MVCSQEIVSLKIWFFSIIRKGLLFVAVII